MSISSRITQIEQHLTDDYSVLELAGADLTNVDKNIFNLKQTWEERLLYFLANGTDEIWNNWEKVTGSGTQISLSNTTEAPMRLVYKGDTQQNGTPTPDTPIPVQVVSGDNTIKVEGKNLIDVIIENNTSSSVSREITVSTPLKAGTYTVRFIGKVSGEQSSCGLMSGSTYIAQLNWYANLKTFTLTEDTTITKVYADVPANRTFYVQLEKGSSASEIYTPYQNQTYPINLSSSNMFDKLQSIYAYRLDTTGQNYPETGYFVSPFIEVEPSTQYTKNSPIADAFHRVAFYTTNNQNFLISVNSNNNTFTTPSTCKYLRFCGEISEISTTQLNEGDVILPYQSYFTPIELCKIGANQDYIYKDNGKWYKYSTIGKIENYNGETISTSYISSTGGLDTDATIYYILTTPTITEITDTTLIYQLEITKNSYSGQTNISQTNADKPFILDVVALKEVS